MVCPRCGKDKYIHTNGKKQCLTCGYEEGGASGKGSRKPSSIQDAGSKSAANREEA